MENKEKLILEKIEALTKQKAKLDSINDMDIPEAPSEKFTYSLEEYSDYAEKMLQRDQVQKLKKYSEEEGQILKNNIEDEIMKLLPVANTWFEVGDFILGYETNDWPSSRSRLLIVDKEDILKIHPLRHQIIN